MKQRHEQDAQQLAKRDETIQRCAVQVTCAVAETPGRGDSSSERCRLRIKPSNLGGVPAIIPTDSLRSGVMERHQKIPKLRCGSVRLSFGFNTDVPSFLKTTKSPLEKPQKSSRRAGRRTTGAARFDISRRTSSAVTISRNFIRSAVVNSFAAHSTLFNSSSRADSSLKTWTRSVFSFSKSAMVF